MTKALIIICLCLLPGISGCLRQKINTSQYNVVWDSPSEDSFGSMPLGNGDIGMNVWVEKNGDLLFYISKVDAFDAGHLLPKLGRVRIKMDPVLTAKRFRQILNLIDASILVEGDDISLRIWVDANQPVIRIEGISKTPRIATIILESLRPLSNASEPLPQDGTAGVFFDDKDNRLAWCYRNQSSIWGENFRKQNTPEMATLTKDPILHRTSGCILQAKDFVRENPTTLKTKGKITSFDCSVGVISSQTEDLEDWLTEISKPVRSDWYAHCKYWESFWHRSYINITSGDKGKFNFDQARFTNAERDSKIYEGFREIDVSQNVFQISQRYALERFCEAAASRGAVPPPFNGSIFTMDMPAGSSQFIERGMRTKAVSADYRDWLGLPFFWQNTRHPYWSMLARGDYDAMMPAFSVIHQSLDVCKDRCMRLFSHEGAYMNEGMMLKGVSVFNDLPPHLKYHYLGTIEMTSIMCDYFEHTRDRKFLEEILLPCADEFIKFYELHYPGRDENGSMIIEPAGVAETYQPVTNPVTEVCGLRYLLAKLLSFDRALIGDERKGHWEKLLQEMPDFPRRTVRGLELLAPGSKYVGRLICETPELYAVWPFQQTSLGNNLFLSNARQSFHVRQVSLDGTPDAQSWETGGWQSAPIWAAYLGLPREAARLVSINFNDRFANFTYRNEDMSPPDPYHLRPRFPAFWETKMDYVPDNDHGSVSASALQSMLVQSNGKKIFLLPAWPENWNVTFKLCAAFNTTVECEYSDGKVKSLKVYPESRRADVIDMSTLKHRIRTLVEVALGDRNYLFGLPPMLDAQPVAGRTTAAWIARYGYTIEDCKAGPWPNALFKGNTVYIHLLNWQNDGVRLSSIPRKLISSESITGNIKVKKDENGWLLTGTPDTLNTIVKLEFDSSVEDIAYGLPSKGSFTVGRKRVEQTAADGSMTAVVDLNTEKTIHRFEFTIDNPGYLRGHGKPFELQIKNRDGNWKTIYNGQIFGTICSKNIEPVSAKTVRLIVHASEIKQFDVF
jgi:alpha-L-fucosidase 2